MAPTASPHSRPRDLQDDISEAYMAADTKLKLMLRKLRDTDLVVTPRLHSYLVTNPELCWKPEVVKRISELLSEPPAARSARFSPSQSGLCLRRQVLNFLGVRGTLHADPRLQSIFNDGKFRHLRWQGTLLDAGILDDVEVEVAWPKRRVSGRMDGHGYVPDEHPMYAGAEFGFELKGENTFVYGNSVRRGTGHKVSYERQYHKYFLISGVDIFVVVQEDKSTNEYHETVVVPQDHLLEEARTELKDLNVSLDRKVLPLALPGAAAGTGECAECPYAGASGPCVSIKGWPKGK